MSYCIVAFHYPHGEQEVAVVHRKWLVGEKCYWPSFWKNSTLLNAALKNGADPDTRSWLQYPVHVVGNRFYDTFREARSNLRTAESGSEFSSEDFSKSRPKRKLANTSVNAGESSSEDEVPFKRSKGRKVANIQTEGLPLPPPPPMPTPSVSCTRPSLVEVIYDDVTRPLQSNVTNTPGQPLFVEPNTRQLLHGSVVLDVGSTGQDGESPSYNPISPGFLADINSQSTSLQMTSGDGAVTDALNRSASQLGTTGEVHSSLQGPGERAHSQPLAVPLKNVVYNVTPLHQPHYTFMSSAESPNNVSSPRFSSSADTQCILAAVSELQNGYALLNAKVDNVSDMVRTLLQGRQANSSSPRSGSVITLPIETLEDFDILEEKIRSDSQEREALVLNLAARGGNSINNITHRVTGTLMTDILMQEFTFAGQSGKRSFKQTMFLQCVCDAVRRNRKGSMATDLEIEKAAEYWLKKASERISRKNNSKSSKKAANQSRESDSELSS